GKDTVATGGGEGPRRQVELAAGAYREAFGHAARSHCAAGWQVNAHLFALEDELGLDYASDTRGSAPFRPAMAGYRGRCPQLPTTLPTLDELVGVDGLSVGGAVERGLDQSATPPPGGVHVYTLHAELEGQRFAPEFARLLDVWKSRGASLLTLAELRRRLGSAPLPVHEVVLGEVPGRSGALALQGRAA